MSTEEWLANTKYLEDLKELFKDLSENLSINTKILIVPEGTTYYQFLYYKNSTIAYPIPKKSVYNYENVEYIVVHLINVFGRGMGYNSKLNTIVLAEINKYS